MNKKHLKVFITGLLLLNITAYVGTPALQTQALDVDVLIQQKTKSLEKLPPKEAQKVIAKLVNTYMKEKMTGFAEEEGLTYQEMQGLREEGQIPADFISGSPLEIQSNLNTFNERANEKEKYSRQSMHTQIQQSAFTQFYQGWADQLQEQVVYQKKQLMEAKKSLEEAISQLRKFPRTVQMCI